MHLTEDKAIAGGARLRRKKFGYLAQAASADVPSDLHALRRAGVEAIVFDRQDTCADRPVLDRMLDELPERAQLLIPAITHLAETSESLLARLHSLHRLESALFIVHGRVAIDLSMSMEAARFVELLANASSPGPVARPPVARHCPAPRGRPAKLTEQQRRECRHLRLEKGLSLHELAFRFGVSVSTVQRVLKARA